MINQRELVHYINGFFDAIGDRAPTFNEWKAFKQKITDLNAEPVKTTNTRSISSAFTDY